jgi:hypothetical protein
MTNSDLYQKDKFALVPGWHPKAININKPPSHGITIAFGSPVMQRHLIILRLILQRTCQYGHAAGRENRSSGFLSRFFHEF